MHNILEKTIKVVTCIFSEVEPGGCIGGPQHMHVIAFYSTAVTRLLQPGDILPLIKVETVSIPCFLQPFHNFTTTL